MVGYQGRPARSAVEQKGVGSRDQGRAVPVEGPDIEEAKRRGGRQGEALQLRAGGEREESQGAADGCGGGVVGAEQWIMSCACNKGSYMPLVRCFDRLCDGEMECSQLHTVTEPHALRMDILLVWLRTNPQYFPCHMTVYVSNSATHVLHLEMPQIAPLHIAPEMPRSRVEERSATYSTRSGCRHSSGLYTPSLHSTTTFLKKRRHSTGSPLVLTKLTSRNSA